MLTGPPGPVFYYFKGYFMNAKFYDDYLLEVHQKTSNMDLKVVFAKKLSFSAGDVEMLIGVAPYKDSYVIGTESSLFSGHMQTFIFSGWYPLPLVKNFSYKLNISIYSNEKIKSTMIVEDLSDGPGSPTKFGEPQVLINPLEMKILEKKFKEVVENYNDRFNKIQTT